MSRTADASSVRVRVVWKKRTSIEHAAGRDSSPAPNTSRMIGNHWMSGVCSGHVRVQGHGDAEETRAGGSMAGADQGGPRGSSRGRGNALRLSRGRRLRRANQERRRSHHPGGAQERLIRSAGARHQADASCRRRPEWLRQVHSHTIRAIRQCAHCRSRCDRATDCADAPEGAAGREAIRERRAAIANGETLRGGNHALRPWRVALDGQGPGSRLQDRVALRLGRFGRTDIGPYLQSCRPGRPQRSGR